MMYEGMRAKNIEKKLNEVDFKANNNYAYAMRKTAMTMLFGSLAELSNQYVFAVDEKNIVLINLTKLANFSDEAPRVLDRREYTITCKNKWFSRRFEIKANSTEEKIVLVCSKVIIGSSWLRKNPKNLQNFLNKN